MSLEWKVWEPGVGDSLWLALYSTVDLRCRLVDITGWDHIPQQMLAVVLGEGSENQHMLQWTT